MASKNLRAIAVRGKNKLEYADMKSLKSLAKWGVENFVHSDIYSLGLLGTASIVESQQECGGLPTRNWKSGVFEGYKKISGMAMDKTILQKRDSCYACTVRCKRVISIDDEEYSVDPYYGGPEYETIAMFGSMCGIDDLNAISYANQICNMYGLDTISCGATIAWAMECYEKGIISEKDTNGLDLRFGNVEAIRVLPKMIALRQGFGDLLAKGSVRASKIIGKGSEKFVVAVKNQEYPAHMPQVKRSLALIYAVNPFGADHESSEHDPSYNYYPERMAEIGLTNPQPDEILNREKVLFALITQYIYSFMDSANACQFVFGPAWQLYGIKQMAEVVSAITGWDYSVQELIETGARRLNMMRIFNARENVGRECDTLPQKIQMPLFGGKSDNQYVEISELENAKDIYYELAGWDVGTGNPTNSRLKELGLDWTIA
jgi:aldehyde:ferredoxin oxidoreductase